MEVIAAGFPGQRMDQHGALQGLARLHKGLPGKEISARLLFAPQRRAGGERLKRRNAVIMAGDTPRMPRPLLQKDRLHSLFEEFEIQRLRGRQQYGGQKKEGTPVRHVSEKPRQTRYHTWSGTGKSHYHPDLAGRLSLVGWNWRGILLFTNSA
jgi:hypothetical protein